MLKNKKNKPEDVQELASKCELSENQVSSNIEDILKIIDTLKIIETTKIINSINDMYKDSEALMMEDSEVNDGEESQRT